MITRVIAAFPGTGKTFFTSNVADHSKVLDLDSSSYTGGHDINGKANNTKFPDNYIVDIQTQLGKVDILFVSIHREVLTRLIEKNINITVIYPEDSLKDEYINRFYQRRSTEQFINLFTKQWEASLRQLKSQKGCRHIILKSGEYVSDVIYME